MKWPHVLTGCVLAASVTALPSNSHVLHEKREVPLSHPRVRVAPDAVIPIRIGLKQSNLHLGYDKLMEVSHPESNKYGQHLSAEEVHDLFAPAEETVQTVKDWLLNSGLEEEDIVPYANKGWLAIDVPANVAERLLLTEYYEHETSDGHRIGCDEYYLPSHVSNHIDFIKPGTSALHTAARNMIEEAKDGVDQI